MRMFNAAQQERRIIERTVAKLPEHVQAFAEDKCFFVLPPKDDVAGSCYGVLRDVSVINLYPRWRQMVKDEDIVQAEFVVVHEIAHAWCFAFGPDVVDDEALADSQQLEWLPISRSVLEERDVLLKLADDLECCVCKGGMDREGKPLSHYDHEQDEWHFLCPSCWAKVSPHGREARQAIAAVLRWRDSGGRLNASLSNEDRRDLEALGLVAP